MKFYLIFLSSIIFLSTPLVTIQEFEETIQTGYVEYEILVQEDNLYYNLMIIWGKIDQGETKIGYGVFLKNKTNDSYQIVVADRFFEREIKQNSRGDTIAYYFDVKNLTNPKLYIYNRQDQIMFEMKLPTVNKVDDFDTKVTISNIGLNDASGIVKTELELGMRSYYTILMTATIVIFVSLIILAIILLKKLSQSKIEPNLTGIKPMHFFGSTQQSLKKDNIWDSYNLDKDHVYDFDQDYDHLSLQEKQKKMAELMQLYNGGLITIEQLNQELRRLW